MAEKRKSLIEKEVFPNCIQVFHTYKNKRKSLDMETSRFVLPGEEIGPLKENARQRPNSMNIVKEWLNKTSSLQTPMPRQRVRKPFSEINVNVDTVPHLKSSQKVFDNKEVIKTNTVTHSKPKKRLNLSLTGDKTVKKKNIKSKNDKEQVCNVIVLDDSQSTEISLDKDKEALKEVEKLSKLECDEIVDYSNEIDHIEREPLTHFNYNDEEFVIRQLQNSIGKQEESLQNSQKVTLLADSRNIFYSEDNLFGKLKQNKFKQQFSIINEEEGDKTKTYKIHIPFYKLGKIVPTKKMYNKNNIEKNKNVSITVRSNNLITAIEISNNKNDIQVRQKCMVNKGVQTDLKSEQKNSDCFPCDFRSKEVRRSLTYNLVKDKRKSLSDSSSCSDENVQRNSGMMVVPVEVHKSPGTIIEDSSSDGSFIDGTPDLNVSKEFPLLQDISKVKTFTKSFTFNKPYEPCFRRPSDACLSTCSSDKENRNPNIEIECSPEGKTCKNSTDKSKRVVFGVLSEMPLERTTVLSILNDSTEMDNVKTLCLRMGWSVTNEFDNNVTHVITSVDDFNRPERSVTYLKALASGKWILSYQWVAECLEQDCHIEEAEYEVLDASSVSAPRFSRLARRRLFAGFKFFCTNPLSSIIDKDSLTYILESLGATVVDNLIEVSASKNESPALLLAETLKNTSQNFRELIKQHGVIPVHLDWAIKCLCSYDLISIRDMLLCPQSCVTWEALKWPAQMITPVYNLRS